MRIGLSKRHIYSLPALEAAWDTAGWGGETDRTRYGCGATESSWLGQNPPPELAMNLRITHRHGKRRMECAKL